MIKVCLDPACDEVAHNIERSEKHCRNCGMRMVRIDEKTYEKKFKYSFFQIDYKTGEYVRPDSSQKLTTQSDAVNDCIFFFKGIGSSWEEAVGQLKKVNAMEIDIKDIHPALLLAFEAGRWLGQVDLEEHFDREQYARAALESIYARKMTMPMAGPSEGRSVQVSLRSDEWRQGVKASCLSYLQKAASLLEAIQ